MEDGVYFSTYLLNTILFNDDDNNNNYCNDGVYGDCSN